MSKGELWTTHIGGSNTNLGGFVFGHLDPVAVVLHLCTAVNAQMLLKLRVNTNELASSQALTALRHVLYGPIRKLSLCLKSWAPVRSK